MLGLVAVALAIAVGVAWGRRSVARERAARRQPPALPEAHPVWDSWRAAWAGDAEAYLACFAAPARERLEAERGAKGPDAFADALRARGAEALAVELARPQAHPDGGVMLPLTVQHEHDAERLDYRVVQQGSGWKIAEIVSRGPTTATPPYAERLAPPAQQGDTR